MVPGGIQRIPRLSRLHLSRTRLLDLLDARTPLTVVRGPAGSGKTALLSEWARNVPSCGLWISMDEAVTDRLSYWHTIITALDDAAFLTEHSPLRTELTAPALRRTLQRGFAQLPGPFVLILDDHGLLDPDLDEDIVTLVHALEELSIVVAGRARTTLEHPRVQAQVDLSLIGPAALSLTLDEVRGLVGRNTRYTDDASGALVHDATGGHPGLVRTVLHYIERTDAAEPRPEDVQQLLRAVVGAQLRRALTDPAQRHGATFLLRCSVPDSLRPDLVKELAAGPDVDQDLHHLETLGALQVDPVTGSVQVVPSLRQILRAEAITRLRHELPDLHARIARIEMDHAPLVALRHATASGDLDLVTTVIIRQWQPFLWGGIITEAEEILEQVPRQELHRQPVIAGLLGLAANTDPNRRARAIGNLSIAVEGARALRRRGTRPQRLLLAVLESSLARIAGDPRMAPARSAARTLDEWGTQVATVEGEPLFRTQLALTLFRSGRADKALHLLRDPATADDDGPGLAQHQALTLKAGIYAHLGMMRKSRALLARIDRLTWPPGLRESYLGAMGHYAAAWDRLEALDPAGAEHCVDLISAQHQHIELHPYLALLRAHIGTLQGRAEEELLRLTEDFDRMEAEQRMLPPERATLQKVGALLNLAAGRTGAARITLEGDGGSPLNSVLRAVMELAVGHPEEALVQLAARRRDPTTPRSAAPQHLVRAAASLRAGDRVGALDAAQRLTALMTYHGLNSHLVYVPRSDLVAIRDLLAAERPDLVKTLGDLSLVPSLLPTPVDIALLSNRENTVLGELSSTGSASEIAATLGVSVNTVKTQLRSIYRKLGASSREQALSVALREGLLMRS